MAVFARDSGVVKEITDAYARHSGVVKPVQEIWARKVDNSVEKVWPTAQVVIDGKTIFVNVFDPTGTNTGGQAAGIRIASNGEIRTGGNTDGQAIPAFNVDPASPWFDPVTAGIGSTYLVSFATGTITGGTTPSFSLSRGSFFSLASNVDMILTIPSGTRSMLWQSTLSISQGGPVLATADIQVSMEIQ